MGKLDLDSLSTAGPGVSSLGHLCLGAYVIVGGLQGSVLIWGSVVCFARLF